METARSWWFVTQSFSLEAWWTVGPGLWRSWCWSHRAKYEGSFRDVARCSKKRFSCFVMLCFPLKEGSCSVSLVLFEFFSLVSPQLPRWHKVTLHGISWFSIVHFEDSWVLINPRCLSTTFVDHGRSAPQLVSMQWCPVRRLVLRCESMIFNVLSMIFRTASSRIALCCIDR